MLHSYLAVHPVVRDYFLNDYEINNNWDRIRFEIPDKQTKDILQKRMVRYSKKLQSLGRLPPVQAPRGVLSMREENLQDNLQESQYHCLSCGRPIDCKHGLCLECEEAEAELSAIERKRKKKKQRERMSYD